MYVLVCVVSVFQESSFYNWLQEFLKQWVSCWPTLLYSSSAVHEASAAQLIFMGLQAPKTTMLLLILGVLIYKWLSPE